MMSKLFFCAPHQDLSIVYSHLFMFNKATHFVQYYNRIPVFTIYKLQNDLESAVKSEENSLPISETVAPSNPKKNNKKSRKLNVDAEPVEATDKSSSDKKQKNDKNAKKQQQQQQTEKCAAVPIEDIAEETKQSAKAKKQKTKKDNKKASKKQQQEDNNRDNISTISEDASSVSEKRDLPKTKKETNKPTKDKLITKYHLDEKVLLNILKYFGCHFLFLSFSFSFRFFFGYAIPLFVFIFIDLHYDCVSGSSFSSFFLFDFDSVRRHIVHIANFWFCFTIIRRLGH